MYRKTNPDLHAAPALPLEQRILAALNGLQYGAVEITVHEGKVVQIERREKFRFPTQPGPKS